MPQQSTGRELADDSWMQLIETISKQDSRVKPYQAATEHEDFQNIACAKKASGGPDRFTVPAFECGAGSTS